MTLKKVLALVVGMGVYGVLIFGGAGTIFWLEGWLFFGLGLIGGAAMLLLKDPELIRERIAMPFQKAQKAWDKVFFALFIPLWLIWLVLNGMDAVRFEWSHVPWPLKVLGGVGLSFGMGLFYWVLRVNTFAAPVVKLQEERGQHVITTGPYAYVRHPMYSGVPFLVLGGALLMGSWYSLAVSAVIIVLFVVRTALEDRTLQRELDGYKDYAQKVQYRLIPGVW